MPGSAASATGSSIQRIPASDTPRSLLRVAGRDGDDLDGAVELVSEFRAVRFEELEQAGADRAEAGDAEFQRLTSGHA